MTDPMLPLAGLSPAGGKAVMAKFDGGKLSLDGGILALRRWSVVSGSPIAWRPAWWTGGPDQITHSLSDIIRFRLLMIGAGMRMATTTGACAAIRRSKWL
jgi:hypothetical protein